MKKFLAIIVLLMAFTYCHAGVLATGLKVNSAIDNPSSYSTTISISTEKANGKSSTNDSLKNQILLFFEWLFR